MRLFLKHLRLEIFQCSHNNHHIFAFISSVKCFLFHETKYLLTGTNKPQMLLIHSTIHKNPSNAVILLLSQTFASTPYGHAGLPTIANVSQANVYLCWWIAARTKTKR